METVINTTNYNLTSPSCLKPYFNGLKVGFFDLETTGLNSLWDKIVLGGLLAFNEEGKGEMFQFFLDKPEKEELLLISLSEKLQELDALVTYNGASFDLPFLVKRMRKYNLKAPLFPFHLDLYRLIKSHSPHALAMANLKQKTVERYFGLSNLRKDEISGEESIKMYEEYLKTKSRSLKDLILLHNLDDLSQLSLLFQKEDVFNVHEGFFYSGFPINDRLYVEKMDLKRDNLTAKGTQFREPVNYYSFSDGENKIGGAFSRDSSLFEISVPLYNKDSTIFADLKGLSLNESKFVNQEGFLILRDENKDNHEGANLLIKEILIKLQEDMR